MLTLQDIRQQYPQYNDMSDQQLADALHSKFYADMPKDQYYQKIGFSAQAPTQQENVASWVSGLSGLNKAYEKLPASIASTLAGATDALAGTNLQSSINNFYNQRAENYQQAINANPMTGMAGEIVGGVARDIPLYYAAGERIPANFVAGFTSGYANADPNASLLSKGISALEGGTTAAALAALPGAKEIFNSFKPEKQAKDIMGYLSGGMNKEEVGQSIAKDIRNAYKGQMEKGSEIYKPVFDQVGSKRVYDLNKIRKDNFNSDDALKTAKDLTGQKFDDLEDVKNYFYKKYSYNFKSDEDLIQLLNSLPDAKSTIANTGKGLLSTSDYLPLAKDAKNFEPDVRKLNERFILNPTFKNAHELRSQLSSSIRQLDKPGADQATRNQVGLYQEAKDALSNDMHSFLDKAGEGLKDQYQAATHFWEKNVAPYRSDKTIYKIAEGLIKNPNNPHNLFANPEPEIQKIAKDIGGNFNNKIVYSKLAQGQSRMDAEKLATAINDLTNKHGLGSYISPGLDQQTGMLEQAIKNRAVIPKWVQRTGENPQVKALANTLSKGINSPMTKAILTPGAVNLADYIRGLF